MQSTRTLNPVRSDHVWHYYRQRGTYKCVLCGGLTKRPVSVDLGELAPDRYERLTDEERALCPFNG